MQICGISQYWNHRVFGDQVRPIYARATGIVASITIWFAALVIFDASGVRAGAIPAAICAGFAFWVGSLITKRFNQPTIPADAEQSNVIPDKQPTDNIVESGGVRMTEVDNRANSNSHKNTPVRTTGANAYALSILLLFAGAAGGYLARHYFGPEEYPLPKTKAECYVAVAKASTERGANVMIDYCDDRFEDFY